MKTFIKNGLPILFLLTAIGFIGSSCGDDSPPCTPQIWYLDADGDGYGTDEFTINECNAKDGYVAQNGDCDDSNPEVNPGATEITLNDIDDNCNGVVDECTTDADCDGVVPYVCVDGVCQIMTTYYRDQDGDTYGDMNNSTISGETAPEGYVSDDSDCDDTNANVHPNATEIVGNGIDDDCDGVAE